MKYARVMLFISILLAASISGCLGGDEEDGEDDGRIGIEREDPGSVVISVDINDDGTRIMWIEGDYPWGENNRSFMVITDIDGGNREVLREGPG